MEKNTAQVKMEFTSEEVNQRINKAYQLVNLQSTLPGFRKGKAPVNVIKKRYPLSELQEDILQDLVRDAIDYFINEKHEEDFIDLPYLKKVEPIQENQSYQITFFADIFPKVTPAELKEKVFDLQISSSVEQIVQAKMNALLDTHATYSDQEKSDQNGYAILEFAFTDQADQASVKSPKTQMISLAEESFQPGLNEKIMKQAIGSVQFYPATKKEGEPDKYIYIKVIAWKKKEIPQFNQEFLDTIQANKQLDVYQEELRQEAEKEYQEQVKEQTINQVLDYMAHNSTFEVIPDNLYQQYLKNRLEDMEHEINKLKLTWEKYLEITKKTQEEIEQEMEPGIIKQIKLDILFRHIAKNHPELSPSEEAITNQASSLIESLKQSAQNFSKEKVDAYVKENLIKGNIIDWLIKEVKVSIKNS